MSTYKEDWEKLETIFEKNQKEFSKEFSDPNKGERKEWDEIFEIRNYISQKNVYDLKKISLLNDNGGLEDFLNHHKQAYRDKLLSFIRFCNELLENEDKFEDFQANLFGINPTANTIKRLYEKIIIEKQLPKYDEFEKIHKKTNGQFLYELLGLKQTDNKYDRGVFLNYVDSKESFEDEFSGIEWKAFKQFKLVFKDDQTKENYDKYYQFLLCKTILRTLLINSKPVVLGCYKVPELNIREITSKNEETVKTLIKEFCREVKLICEPINDIDWAKYNIDERGDYKKQLDHKIKELKALQEQSELIFNKLNIDTTRFLSSNDLSIIEAQKKEFEKCNTLKFIENELGEIDKIFDLLKSTRQKIANIQGMCRKTQEFIKREFDIALAKYTPENVNKNVRGVLSFVDSQFEKVQNKYDDFVNKYDEKSVEREKNRFNTLKNDFDEIIEKIITKLKSILQKQSITRGFVMLQIGLLGVLLGKPAAYSDNWGLVLYWLNASALTGYIIFIIRQFNKYKQIEFILKNLGENDSDNCSKGRLSLRIFVAFVFYGLVQYSIMMNSRYIFLYFLGFLFCVATAKKKTSDGKATMATMLINIIKKI